MKKTNFFCFMLVMLVSCSEREEEKLTVACAANFEEAADSLLNVFESKNNIETELIINASGSLTAQIEAGAPYHIFISANKSYPEELYQKNITEKPEVFAVGNLVFVYPKADKFEHLDTYLLSDQVGKIALADPEIAPFGKAAVQYLQSVELFDTLESKIVYGDNIGQVNQFFTSGAVDVMFSSNSFIQALADDEDAVHIYTGYDNIYHSAVMVVTDDRTAQSNSREFMEFLRGSESSKILEYFGYSTK